MIITLSTNTKYDTAIEAERARLMNYLPTLGTKRADELVNIHNQLKNAATVTLADITIANELTPKPAQKLNPPQKYLNSKRPEEPNTLFTFVNGKFYALPKTANAEDIPWTLIDTLLYENQRHDWDDEPCLTLRHMLIKFLPNSFLKSRSYFEKELATAEEQQATYFSDYLSDDSDSEQEEEFTALPQETRAQKIITAKAFRDYTNYTSYLASMNGQSKAPKPNLKLRPVIHRADNFNFHQTKADLKTINAKLKAGQRLTPEFLASLNTQFVVAQYRGIHYTTDGWDAVARRMHRAMNEVNKPQFSSSVFSQLNVSGYHDFLDRLKTDNTFQNQLIKTAKVLQNLMLTMQHTSPVSYKGYTYLCFLYLLQYWYSYNYSGYESMVKKELGKPNSPLTPFLLNAKRPFLSTSDLPYHALRYAYGTKLYEEYQKNRLHPHWRNDGRAERPHSGKVYVSLHPLNDYTDLNPSHLTSFFKHGLIPLNNVVVAERETAFLAYLPANRVAIQHAAKFPSFKGDYKKIYATKYGIGASMYTKLKTKFAEFPPHSEQRINLENVLSEYLIAYHEVRLIDTAQRQAEEQDKVLIYRDEDGGFSLNHPNTPSTANKRLGPEIMAERERYKALAPNQAAALTTLNKPTTLQKLDELADELPEYKQLKYRLFDYKQNPPSAQPIAVLTMTHN